MTHAKIEPRSARAALEPKTLLVRLQAGEERACEELLRRHGGTLLAVARRLLGDEGRACAALADACLIAFRSAQRCPSEEQLVPWLRGLVVETCLDRLDTSALGSATAVRELLPDYDASGNHAHTVTSWAQPALAHGELQAEVRRCLERLPDAQRVAVLLCDVEELAPRVVAERLGLAPDEVLERLHEGRQALVTLLGPSFGVGPGDIC